MQQFEKSQMIREQQHLMEQAESAAQARLTGDAPRRLSPAAMEARATALREMMALEKRSMELEAIEAKQRKDLSDAQSELERTKGAAESARGVMRAAEAARDKQREQAQRVKDETNAAVARADAERDTTQRALAK